MARTISFDKWERGNADDLAEVAGRFLAERHRREDSRTMMFRSTRAEGRLTSDMVDPDERLERDKRLIRDYCQRGIVQKPEIRGKEAVYGRRQLLQFIAARILSADWSLDDIAWIVGPSEDADLESLIRGEDSTFLRHATRAMGFKAELRSAFRKLSLDPTLLNGEKNIVIPIATWCQVMVESDRLPNVTFNEAEGIGEAITAALQIPAMQDWSSASDPRRRNTRAAGFEAALRDATRELGLPRNMPVSGEVTVLVVATWCQVLIGSECPARVTADEAEGIGRAITGALLNPDIRLGAIDKAGLDRVMTVGVRKGTR